MSRSEHPGRSIHPWDGHPIRLARPQHECGVFGIFSTDPDFDAAGDTYLGLYALQHRGQESAGMVVSDGETLRLHKEMGLVASVFDDEILKKLPGPIAIGHVRYSTTGASRLENAQPLLSHTAHGLMAVAHNGNLANAEKLRQRLLGTGSVFQSTTDSEVIINLIASYGQDSLERAVVKCAQELRGGYSVLLMTKDRLIGFRDAYGIRPLCLGRLGEAYVMASESCALETLGAEYIREIRAGEVVMVDKNGLMSIQAVQKERDAFCVFEYIYFARPDTDFEDRNVHLVRKDIGRQLAREYPVEADVVIPAPDSGIPAAIGYSEESGIPLDIGLIKNRYIGRTFIQPTQAMRQRSVKIKLNPIEKVVKGKRVVLIDDSIVRGTTSQKIVKMLRDAGATEVHMRVASPPYLHSCYYGIDTAARQELIAYARSVEEIRQQIGADSLGYLSQDGLEKAVDIPMNRLCTACFTGLYPTEVPEEVAGGKARVDTGCS